MWLGGGSLDSFLGGRMIRCWTADEFVAGQWIHLLLGGGSLDSLLGGGSGRRIIVLLGKGNIFVAGRGIL